MIQIPEMLKKEEFRFILLKSKDKIPIEFNWTNKNNYKFNDPQLLSYIEKQGNYGVVTGFGNLLVIDFDDLEIYNILKNYLPKTFTTISGSGLPHFYYISDKTPSFKILDDELKTKLDVQGSGKQIVGASCIHPNGNTYKIKENIEIANISIENLKAVFMSHLPKSWLPKNWFKKIVDVRYEKNDIVDEIKDKLKISSLLFENNINISLNPTNCPFHASKRGKCFSFDDSIGIWHCFHCDKGGDVITLFQELNNYDFKEAIKYLCKKLDIKIKTTKISKAISLFIDKRLLAEEFFKVQPYFFDRAKMWWFWDFNHNYWKTIDEIDLLNELFNNKGVVTLNSRERGEILEALKQVGRTKIPKPIEKTWIQFKNKIIDVKTSEEYDPTPEYFAVNPIPWKIGKNEDTPKIDNLFMEWVGSDNKNLLYEIIAYCMIPDYPIHRIFCLFGEGLNGKSTYLKILKKFIGSHNVTSSELDRLLISRFEISKLYKKLVCIMGETNFEIMGKTSILKQLTGQDIIGIEFKNKDLFNTVNYSKIIIATNSLPPTTDKTIGFYRRWLIVDFPQRFSEKKDVFDSIPEWEFDNLCLKCIPILHKLINEREFINEGTIEDRKKRFEDRSNPFDKFIKDFVDESDCEGFIQKWDFKFKFDEWCKENKFRKLSDKSISKLMREKGIEGKVMQMPWYSKEGKKPTQRCWIEIKWKDVD